MAEKTHEFGPVLKAWRKTNRWTLADVAAEVGCVTSTISNYERGERYCTAGDAAVLAVLTGLPVETLGGMKAVRAGDAFRALHGGES